LKDSIPLWVLFIAAQWLDIVWCTLMLLGINKVQILGGSAQHEKDAGETGAIRNARSSTVRSRRWNGQKRFDEIPQCVGPI
jgi:hypothetical protein